MFKKAKRELQKKILQISVENLTSSISGEYELLRRYRFSEELMHCVADNATAEETILYLIRKQVARARHPHDLSYLRIVAPERRTGNYSLLRDGRVADWFSIAKKWRDEGKVRAESLVKFEEVLGKAKKRWPQPFSGEKSENE